MLAHKDAIAAIEAKQEFERTEDEAEQLAEHNGKKKRKVEYDANYRQAHKDAIAAIEAKPEGEQLVEHNDKKKKKNKKDREEIQRLSGGTKEGENMQTELFPVS